MPIRKRHAFVYPGKQRVGVTLVVTDDNKIRSIAIGTVDHSKIGDIFTKFRPGQITYATDRIENKGAVVPIPEGLIPSLRVAKSGWYENNLRNPVRIGSGKFGNFAYRIAFSEIVIHGPYSFAYKHSFHILDDAWVEANSPPRILR